MINFILTVLLASLFVFDWLFFVMGVGGRIMTWIPEFIAIFIAISIPFRTATSKQTRLPLKYSMLLTLYLLHILIGFFLNQVAGFTMLAGLRIYTKFIPIFLVPLIYPFTESVFKKIILWIFALSMLQFPVVVWQRFFKYATSISGDPMGGTLGMSTSGVLAIYLIIIISFLISFYFKEEISLPVFLLSSAAAFIPITLNETKISFVLLPFAFIFPALFIRGKREVIIRVLLVLLLFAVSFTALKGTYDHFAKQRWGYGITGFFTDTGIIKKYNEYRILPIKNAFVKASEEPRFIFFGRGAGNVSEGFTRELSGKYVEEGRRYNVGITFVKLMWEIGMMGTILFFLFLFFIFWDAVRFSKQDGVSGAFALGMVSGTFFFTVSTFYTFTLDSNVLIFMFFLAAGQLVSLDPGFDKALVPEKYEVVESISIS